MSFNEFIQWLRSLFGNNNQPTPPSSTTPSPTPTPSPVDETPSYDPPVTPRLKAIQTSDSKVALKQNIEFQIITEPAGHYSECEVDLTNTSGSTLISDINTETGTFVVRFDIASKSENDIQRIQVTHPGGNLAKVVTVSQMKLFWHHHSGRENICDETLFANQCAIRMGAALELSGIVLPLDRRIMRRCTTEYRAFADHKQGLVKGHVLAAQELANWIKSEPSIFGSREVLQSKEDVIGRSGLIFFRDGWGTTDHIDVWDGESLVGGFPSYFDSSYKDLWFWEIY